MVVFVGCGTLEGNSVGSNSSNAAGSNLAYEGLTAPNELMGNASAEYSAFMFSVFDGEIVQSKIIFQSVSFRQSIIDELASVPVVRVTDWTLQDITLPIYGISMGTTCGYGIQAAWSNGFWITQTGDAYRFDFDFEEFTQRHHWDSLDSHMNFAWFPNAINLTQDEDGWSNRLLTPAMELNPPEGIKMALVSNSNEDVTFTLTNNNDKYWFYGTPFRVDVLLDGIWYSIPTTTENWGFADIGLILDAGRTETKTYSLQMYGELPSGTYRLVKHDMYVIFEIE